MKPTVVSLEDLSLTAEDIQPRVSLTRQFVPVVEKNCEMIEGSAAEMSAQLVQRLRDDGVLQ